MNQRLQVLIEDLNHVSKLSIVISLKDTSIKSLFTNVNCQLLPQSLLLIDFQLSSNSDNNSSNQTTYRCSIPLPSKYYDISSFQVYISDYITWNISYSNDNNTAHKSIPENSNDNFDIDNSSINIHCIKCRSCLTKDVLTSIQELPSGELDMVRRVICTVLFL